MSKHMVQVRGAFGGEVGSAWRPAISGTLNQTGQADAEASTFDSSEEAREVGDQFCQDAQEWRVVPVAS